MKKSEFERVVDKAMWSLETRHGLKKVETKFRHNGCQVRFQNATTEVALNYEIGEVPWFTLADLREPETERASFDWLLVELGQKTAPTVNEAFFPQKLDESRFGENLQAQADLMLEHASSLLKGDFNILPALKKRADQYLLECKRFADLHKAKD
jgi:hypothetical protein